MDKSSSTVGAEVAAATRERRGEQKAADYNRRGEIYEEQLLKALRAQFDMQKEAILKTANTTHLAGYNGRHVTKRAKGDYLDQLADWDSYDESMKQAIAPILYALIIETGQSAMTDLGMDASMFNGISDEVMEYYQARAGKIATDVNDETEKQLRASISQGIADEETDDELQARIEKVMGAASTYRADRIARTEVTRAQGFADVEAWDQSGVVTGKEFYCVQDERTCPFCLELDGRIVGLNSDFYSLGDVVHAGGRTLNISYDDIPTPPLHANCRCQCLPVTLPLDAVTAGAE